jgi:hypothetical protein
MKGNKGNNNNDEGCGLFKSRKPELGRLWKAKRNLRSPSRPGGVRTQYSPSSVAATTFSDDNGN